VSFLGQVLRHFPNSVRPVDISSTDHTCKDGCFAITIGGGGNIKFTMIGENTAGGDILTVVAGQRLDGLFATVVKTGTTATNMVEWYNVTTI
jgi:hypothetical protein